MLSQLFCYRWCCCCRLSFIVCVFMFAVVCCFTSCTCWHQNCEPFQIILPLYYPYYYCNVFLYLLQPHCCLSILFMVFSVQFCCIITEYGHAHSQKVVGRMLNAECRNADRGSVGWSAWGLNLSGTKKYYKKSSTNWHLDSAVHMLEQKKILMAIVRFATMRYFVAFAGRWGTKNEPW